MTCKHNGKWYALFVQTGEEDNVKERLKYKFKDGRLSAIVPKRKLRERKNGIWDYKIRNLFPGYVLLNGKIGVEEYYSIKGIPGTIKLLSDKTEPLEIEEYEIDVISRLTGNSEVIGISDALMENGRIVILNGPLKGMDGLIQYVDKRKGRVKVRLDFIGEPRLVELSINMIQPA